MARLTIVFGILLIIVGLMGFVETGSEHPTALIPSYFGILLGVTGFMALKPERRALWMHIAVTVGLLGFLGTVKSAFDVYRLAHGVDYPHPIAVLEKSAMCLLCLLFVGLCVRSFIEARRARVAV